MADHPFEQAGHENPNWLQIKLDQAVRDGWCTRMHCTTCGSPEMKELLVGCETDTYRMGLWLDQLTFERAEKVIKGLVPVMPPNPEENIVEYRRGKGGRQRFWRVPEGGKYEDAVMWLLFGIWYEFGDRAHAELFPALEGSWASSVLNKMKDHYAR